MALAVAEKLVELGAIPLTLSDASGVVYEPDGFDAAKVKTVSTRTMYVRTVSTWACTCACVLGPWAYVCLGWCTCAL